jgi:hypothetical protein
MGQGHMDALMSSCAIACSHALAANHLWQSTQIESLRNLHCCGNWSAVEEQD